MSESREKALQRAEQLKQSIRDYTEALPAIPTGFQQWPRIQKNQEKLRSLFQATAQDWQNWRWHLKNRIATPELLNEYLPLSPIQLEEIERTGASYRWAVSPYYLSLIDPGDPADPIRAQSIPSLAECIDTVGISDPMDEEHTSPAP
ncbi:MAG: lysine 2,3-aminomutase, partial [Firmicutes bacterium]|nr:lysine 2,3-aminomutase [Bacillota bacterium]